jgi:HD-GYP domain-containing protein (c-di-GMP phosphodiesterase class II)
MSAYAGHLASLQEKTQVLASEDIVSDRGVLIVKSGTEINSKACQNILKFKLLKPLEDSIFIANQLTAKSIFEQIVDLLNRDPFLKSLNSRLGQAKILQACCLRLGKYPLLLQKLTVMDMEITDVFRQSLLSGYLAMLSGITEKQSQDKIEENFLAGIVHDIGLLHIDRYILTKKETLAVEEWRKIQSHPIIGYEILNRIATFPKNVARAVLEHHEKLDGSGYPRAKTVHDLGSLGQLLSLLDSVIVIYNKKFKPYKQSLNSVIPILQINMHSYLPKVVSSVFKLLKQTPPSVIDIVNLSIVDDLINHVAEQQNYINTLVNAIQQVNDDISYSHNNKDIYAIQNIAINILVIINSAGLNNENLQWQQTLKNDSEKKNYYHELEAIRLIQEEIIYQVNTYQKSTTVFISKNTDNPMSTSLQKAIDVFTQSKPHSTPALLQAHWDTLAKQ